MKNQQPLVNYQQKGEGPDVLLIHGLFGSLENLNMVAKGLINQYRVTSIDVRNHGSSFHENNMDYSELALDVTRLVDHLQIEKTHVLGHSMGGKIAMEFALSFPERMNKLIVADIAPVEYPPHHQKIIEGLQSIDFSLVLKRKDADNQLADYVEDSGVRQFLLRNLSNHEGVFNFKCNLEFIAQCYPQIMKAYQGGSIFSGETLFIKGGNSDYIKSEYRSSIAKILPNSTAKIIQGAGHWLHAEKTVAFNKIVLDFLSK
jgi:esterase